MVCVWAFDGVAYIDQYVLFLLNIYTYTYTQYLFLKCYIYRPTPIECIRRCMVDSKEVPFIHGWQESKTKYTFYFYIAQTVYIHAFICNCSKLI